MAFDSKLIPLLTEVIQDSRWWNGWKKAELICQLNGAKHIESVILIRLSGGDYTVYQQLNEKCTDFSYRMI